MSMVNRLLQALSSCVPESLREWVIRKLRSGIFRQGVPRGALPVDALAFLPTNKVSESYVIGAWPDEDQYEKDEYGLPAPPAPYRLGYGADTAEWLRMGKEHVGTMLDALRAQEFELSAGNRALELGCAAARLLRHLHPYADRCELWGVDINAEVMHWCHRYMTPPFHFATTPTLPHLPYEQHYFDLIFAGSVFTHIDDLARAWLLELNRVLKPGAFLYVTIHDRHCMSLLEPEYVRDKLPAVKQRTNQTRLGQQNFSKRLARNDFYQEWKDKPFDFLVIGRDSLSQVFCELAHFEKLVQPMFRMVSSHPEAYGYQTGVLLKRN